MGLSECHSVGGNHGGQRLAPWLMVFQQTYLLGAPSRTLPVYSRAIVPSNVTFNLTPAISSVIVAGILTRIDRASLDNFGDVEPVGDGVSEMRIDFGPGYRVYYTREGRVIYLLLTGGDKFTQTADIKR